MLAIRAELLHGTYRADPDGLARTGRLERGEWPPAPLRLLAALVAADGTGAACRHTDGTELTFLEGCAPPTIYASAPDRVWHQPLQPRYVARAQAGFAKDKPTGPEIAHHAEYVGRKGAEVRPGVRVAPASPSVVYAWDVEPPPEILRALARRAARVGYLGCADSPVKLTVSTGVPADVGEPFVPDDEGSVTIAVPRPGVLAAMIAHYELWQQMGPSLHRSQATGLRRFARYRPPGTAAPSASEPAPATLWMVLEPAVSGRRVAAVAAAFKAALLDLYQRQLGDPPAVLHGHGLRGEDYELARFLALPDVGAARSRGRIHGLALWLPAERPDTLLEECRAALRGLVTLVGSGFSASCRIWAGEERPWAANPRRWQGPSTRWATAFPAVYERRARHLDLETVANWCTHAGLRGPAAFRASRAPLIPGGVDLLPAEVNRPGRDAKPYTHLELLFDTPVRGPVVVGGARQRGLGLCAPLPEEEDSRG